MVTLRTGDDPRASAPGQERSRPDGSHQQGPREGPEAAGEAVRPGGERSEADQPAIGSVPEVADVPTDGDRATDAAPEDAAGADAAAESNTDTASAHGLPPAVGQTPAAGQSPGGQDTSRERRRATRITDGAWLGGVCAGLARHLGWPVMVLRIAFVALAVTQFVGVIAYGALWLLMPPEQPNVAPGLASAGRRGMRDHAKTRPSRRRRADVGTLLALIVLGAGLIGIVQISGLGISQQIFWPVAFACAGAALVWRQADSTRQQAWKNEAGGRVWLAPLVARGGWPAVMRVVIGLALVGAAFGLVLAQHNQLDQLPDVLAMTVLALAGLAIVAAPWLHRSRVALNEARAEKVRADARADMAAHLHDSVLQTLALIQREAGDPQQVQRLARRQERELRSWLYGDDVTESTCAAALREAAAEVEDERGTPVEVVTVGDCEMTEPVSALIKAARESMVNAAKHSGSDNIDVFAEVADGSVEVFVRDRGTGFDPDAIADDRMGVRGSIIGRMARHGGSASIRSNPGEGTEIRLRLEMDQ